MESLLKSIRIKKLGYNDLEIFEELIRVFEEVFEMKDFNMPGKDYLSGLLQQQGFFVFVALTDEKVTGGLTAYSLHQYYSTKPLMYVYDLAVLKRFQRQGIGKTLMNNLTTYCKNMGMEEVFVQADEEDGHALDFYRSTGAVGEKVVHFYYPLNKPLNE